MVPELRQGCPVWLIGRQINAPTSQRDPRYLSLPGRKPLLGWEETVAAGLHQVTVVEGPLDWLALRAWGVPALALCGSLVRPTALEGLRRFARVYLALDADEGGNKGTQVLLAALGERARRICLPPGCKDVAELAPLPDGARLFAAALRAAGQSRATAH